MRLDGNLKVANYTLINQRIFENLGL
jgi:hypothetical protein